MKAHPYRWLIVSLLLSCHHKQAGADIENQIKSAKQDEINAEAELSDFKSRHASDFKTFDSLKEKGLITPRLQIAQDSLMIEEIHITTETVTARMKIIELQKRQK